MLFRLHKLEGIFHGEGFHRWDTMGKYVRQRFQDRRTIYKYIKSKSVCNPYTAETRKGCVVGGGTVWLCWCVLLLIRQPSKIPLSKGHFFSCRPPVGHRSDPWQLNKLSCSSISSFILWESEAHLSSARRPRLQPPSPGLSRDRRTFSGELDETWHPSTNLRDAYRYVTLTVSGSRDVCRRTRSGGAPIKRYLYCVARWHSLIRSKEINFFSKQDTGLHFKMLKNRPGFVTM
jgi:hypothetical protein